MAGSGAGDVSPFVNLITNPEFAAGGFDGWEQPPSAFNAVQWEDGYQVIAHKVVETVHDASENVCSSYASPLGTCHLRLSSWQSVRGVM